MAESEYRTVGNDCRTEQTINRSRFIASASHVCSENDALAFINKIRREFPDATHNCYAYVLGHGQIARHSDDGEPSGTAGLPILEAIQGRALTQTAVVVTRYFGGTLLGTGGLVRAYSRTAGKCLDMAGVSLYRRHAIYSFVVDYSVYSRLSRLDGIMVTKMDFAEKVAVEIGLDCEHERAIFDKIADVCAGTAEYERIGESYLKIDFSYGGMNDDNNH
ncbi:MAG TPA: YigZ family protein [Clostridia bacterium]|nr:YigZ family protein [Clostridia bacterium]